MRGGYSVSEVAGLQTFSTTADFFFDGAPEPGFALSPDGVLSHSHALSSDFLRLLPNVSNSGVVTAPLPSGFDIREQKTVFLWCYFARFLLGDAPVVLVGN
ncbi:hypothetical protein [Primorskyibacter sedentarius]|nr:hypothetical protein [Primorskyibacter sedentarius]